MADPVYRAQRMEELRRGHREATERARAWAERTGSPMRIEVDGAVLDLIDYTDAMGPIYRTTLNLNAAISTAADLVGKAPYHLSGAGIAAGIWDGGNVRATHTEFSDGRVTNYNSAGLSDHATHVAGTMIARGANADARGMATNALLYAYDWNKDLLDMNARALADPGNPSNKIQISNHSYGFLAGWSWGFTPVRWYGTWDGSRESDYFGMYIDYDQDVDKLVYDAVYYLPVFAAGNDRGDTPPAQDSPFEYWHNGSWRSKNYDSNTDPLADGQKGGYNIIPFGGVAKNNLLVGAVHDAVTGSQRDPSKAAQAWFSSWGPTDDGRIKPDIVANGISLTSSISSGDNDYVAMWGTSMAAPNASGSAILLIEHYGNLFPGHYMWASTLKALIIHTADSLDAPGPDYRNGWGLMNTKAAADHLTEHRDFTGANRLVESVLSSTNGFRQYEIYGHPGNPIRATLAWTDPPGEPVYGLNSTNRMLVNDLDLRIVDPLSSTNYPWVLDFSNPADPAATGDNVLDNVEQVYIADPPTGGVYLVQVSHKGTLTDGEQYFSLLISGNPNTNAAEVFLFDLAHVYDATAKQASATTLPAGLSVELTYNGLAGAPTAAGAYAVTGTVNDAYWQGTVSDTLTIAKAFPGIEESPAASDILHGQALTESILSGGSATNASGHAVPGDFSFDDPELLPPVGIYSASTTFTPIDTNNYLTAGHAVNIVVIDSRVLTVESDYGSPAPATGEHLFARDTVLTNSVGVTTIVTNDATQHIAAGWIMQDNEPAAGTGTVFVMILTNDAHLVWQWNTEYRYGVGAMPGGSVTGTPSGWYAPGTVVSNTVLAREDCVFTGWTGVPPGMETDNPLVFELNQGYPHVTARFRALRPEGFFMQIK